MKNYRQLIKGLPSKTVIMTVGSFNPPTSVNEMAFKLVDKLVESHNADHIIYVTEDKDNLPIDRKLHFLELMFGAMNFKPLNESNLTSELIRLKSKYKDVIVVSSEDKAKLYESLQVVTTSNDLDHSKIKSYVTKGDFASFKKQMPSTLRELDARRLMNEMRHVTGLELLKEEVKFTVDALREKYFKGQIYHIGDIVESAGQQYEIMDRGSNYLVVVNNTGDLSRKWIKDVKLVEACWTGYKQVGTKKKGSRTVPNCVPESVLNPADPHKDYAEKSKTLQDLSRNKDVDQKAVQQRRLDLDKEYGKLKEEVFSYKGYVPKNLNSELVEAFKLAAIDSKDPVAMLNAIKTTDTYLQLHGKIGENPDINQLKTYKDAHIKATEALQKIGVYDADEEKPDTKIARNVLTYQDFMKAGKEHMPENPEKYVGEPHTTPGHTLATRQHLRRQKVAYVNEQASVTDGEVEGQVVTKIKPLPIELAPPPDEPGKQRGKGNSAFFEKKNKKVEKEALDYLDLDSWLRQQSPQAHG
jgi:hypothetical protein